MGPRPLGWWPAALVSAASTTNFYSVEMGIGSWERIDPAGKVVESEPVLIDLSSPSARLTADEALTVAYNLIAMAAKLRKIQAES